MKDSPALRLVVSVGLSIGLSIAAAAPCVAACPQAVFFDLGDTLVEPGGGGLFVVRAGAQETVDQLRAMGLQLGIITNVPSDWTLDDLEAVLADPGFLDDFDVVVLSSQAPAPKPDPAIYLFAHGQLPTSVPIESTAFVGETLGEIADSVDAPTQGARAVGMLGIHLSDAPASPLADFTIPTDGLLDIPPLVEALCPFFADGFESGDTMAWVASP